MHYCLKCSKPTGYYSKAGIKLSHCCNATVLSGKELTELFKSL